MKKLFLAFLFMICLSARGEEIQKQPSPVPTEMQVQGTTYSAYEGNDKIWEMRADRVEGDARKAKAYQIRGTLFRKGKPRYSLKSQIAYINLGTEDMLFPNGVLLLGVKGERIWARVLNWKAREKKFVGTKGVRVVHWNTRLKGDRMVLDHEMKDIVVEGHVKAEVVPGG